MNNKPVVIKSGIKRALRLLAADTDSTFNQTTGQLKRERQSATSRIIGKQSLGEPVRGSCPGAIESSLNLMPSSSYSSLVPALGPYSKRTKSHDTRLQTLRQPAPPVRVTLVRTTWAQLGQTWFLVHSPKMLVWFRSVNVEKCRPRACAVPW